MKVLYLVPQAKRPQRISAYTFLDEEIHALAKAGIQTYVLSGKVQHDMSYGPVRMKAARKSTARRTAVTRFLATHASQVPLRYLLDPKPLFFAARVESQATKIIEQEGIDVIHSHFAWPQGFGGILARESTGRPLVASLRGTDILLDDEIDYGRRESGAYDRALRRLLTTADRTVYFSRYMRDHGVALGARPDATRVIRKGVDLSHFTVADDRVALRQSLGLGARPMILTVAGLIPRKGIHHILEALGRLKDRTDFTFVICGEGPEQARLEALSATLGLRDRTVFMGQVDRPLIPKYFAACDVFVLASIMEAAGNVLFEAMSAGRPIVCTDSGGPPEYVRNDETGFVVPVNDPQALADRIGALLADPALQDRLGREGRRRTIGEFDFGRMVADLIGVYEDVLRADTRRHAVA
jgi:glycosyltransferase involved in cell wall biosynthesis